MAVAINSLSKKAWNKFIKEGMTKAGAAGLLGNIYSESGMIANRVEILCLKRIKEYYGVTYTDASYTAAVDSGKISKERFLNPLPNKVYGYGLIQLTSISRKRGLYERTVEKGKSIADEDIQLEYIIYELKNLFPSVWKVLTTANSVKEASDKVLKDFEAPSNWSQYSALRAGYGQEYYNAYASTTTTAKATTSTTSTTAAINALIATAKAEIGYLEKRSNANLDDKTANAGSSNYTKYWRDVYPQYAGQPWCAAFVSWCMMKTFGLETAKKLLKHWPYVYCPTMANLFKLNANPKVGDIVIFYRNGEFAHTGLVIAVNGDQFTTIEGNTSGGSTIVPNGGGVCQKTYYNSNLPGTKFCTPDYSIVTSIKNTATQTSTASKASTSSGDKFKGTVTKQTKVRTWAGNENKEVSFSPLKKGASIEVQYSLKANDGSEWYYFKYDGKYAFIPANNVSKEKGGTTGTTTTSTSKNGYRVQSGAFSVKSNAEARLKEMEAAGFDAVLIKTGTLWVVQLGMFSNINNAYKLKDQIEAAGFECAVI